jgi:hypothetical protein
VQCGADSGGYRSGGILRIDGVEKKRDAENHAENRGPMLELPIIGFHFNGPLMNRLSSKGTLPLAKQHFRDGEIGQIYEIKETGKPEKATRQSPSEGH